MKFVRKRGTHTPQGEGNWPGDPLGTFALRSAVNAKAAALHLSRTHGAVHGVPDTVMRRAASSACEERPLTGCEMTLDGGK